MRVGCGGLASSHTTKHPSGTPAGCPKIQLSFDALHADPPQIPQGEDSVPRGCALHFGGHVQAQIVPCSSNWPAVSTGPVSPCSGLINFLEWSTELTGETHSPDAQFV